MERIAKGLFHLSLWTPAHLVQLVHVFVVLKSTGEMPDTDAVVDSQSRTSSGRKDMLSIRRPLAHSRVRPFDGGDLLMTFFQIIDIHLTSQVTKTGDDNESTVRRKHNGVSRCQWVAVCGNTAEVENGRLGWHESIDNSEFLRVG